ncbi:MAG: type III-B CRISPR-associated protein Cas10/Cmr2, partial [Anaerolineaceae bacterium]
IAMCAKNKLKKYSPTFDPTWDNIWNRQVNNIWEIYWASVELGGDYKQDMARAQATLDGVKRTRSFTPSEESGPKDTLSGRRSALHTDKTSPMEYWKQVASNVKNSRLLANGRERLDAQGVVKRFYDNQTFPSTSSVASKTFLAKLLQDPKGSKLLEEYRNIIEELGCFTVCDDPDWPYDGDLLYEEILTEKRLEEDYYIDKGKLKPGKLQEAKEKLKKIYSEMSGRPSPYYALIVMDGDSMGEHFGDCSSKEESRKLSHKLSDFASTVEKISQDHNACVIYNGGDDVMALAPLSEGLNFSKELADKFHTITGCSMSAGIAIGHHQYPLRAVLEAAQHQAEHKAKHVADGKKAAVCVMALKRSGETRTACSHWDDLGDNMETLVTLLQEKQLSTRLAYAMEEEARIGTALPLDAQSAILKRLIIRHRGKAPTGSTPFDPPILGQSLMEWVNGLNCTSVSSAVEGKVISTGFAELGTWMVLAHFIAEGGKE